MKLCVRCERPAFATDTLLCAACEEYAVQMAEQRRAERLAAEKEMRPCAADGCTEIVSIHSGTHLCRRHRDLRWREKHRLKCADCPALVGYKSARCRSCSAKEQARTADAVRLTRMPLREQDFMVLTAMLDGKPWSARALAETTGLDSQLASGSCSVLKTRGLAVQWAGQKRTWSLTDAGLALARERKVAA